MDKFVQLRWRGELSQFQRQQKFFNLSQGERAEFLLWVSFGEPLPDTEHHCAIETFWVTHPGGELPVLDFSLPMLFCYPNQCLEIRLVNCLVVQVLRLLELEIEPACELPQQEAGQDVRNRA